MTARSAYAFETFNRFDDDGWGFDMDGDTLGDEGLPGARLFGRALGFWAHCQHAVGQQPTVAEAAATFHCPPDLIRSYFADRNSPFLYLRGDHIEIDGA